MFAAPNPGRPLPPPPHLQYNLPPLKLFQQPHEPKPLPVTVLDEKKLDTVAPAKGFKVGQEDVTMVQDMATTKDAKNTEQDVALTTPMDVALTTPMDVDLVPSIPGNIEEASTEHGNAMEIPNEAVAKAEATVGVEQAPLDLANTVDTSAIETGGPGSAHTVTVADSTDSVDSVTTNDAPTKKKRTTNRRTPVVESQPTMTSPKRSARNSAKSEGSTSGAAAAAASVQTAAQASTPIASEESVKSSATTLAPTDDSVRNGRTRKKSNPVKATETPADVVGAKVNAEPTSSSRASGRRSASSPKRK